MSDVKDVKGRKIKEGDRVKLAYDELYSPILPNFEGIVVFREGKLQVDNGEMTVELWQEIAQWEVIEREVKCVK